MRPESNQQLLFVPPPQFLVIRLVVKQLKYSSKAKGAHAHQHVSSIDFSNTLKGGGLPSLFHAQLHVQLPSARPTAADVLEWTRVEGARLGVEGEVGLRVSPKTEEDWPEKKPLALAGLGLACHSKYMLVLQER